MDVSYVAVIVATVAMFAVGMVWFGPLFGGLWGRIHGFDKLSKAEQKALMAKMGPLYIFQFILTLISAWVLAKLFTLLPDYSVYTLAALVWFGFTAPAQASSVIFGGAKPEWFVKKIAVMVVGSLIPLLVAAAIISAIQK